MMDAQSNIDAYINQQSDWQADNLRLFRRLINEVDPTITEDWKWAVPVFLHNKKLVCAMSTFKDHTKFNFFEGASLSDPKGIFNNGLTSKRHRSIDLSEGENIDEDALKAVISEAVTYAEA